MASGFGAGAIEDRLDIGGIGGCQTGAIHFVRGIVVFAGDGQHDEATNRKKDPDAGG